MNREWAPTHHAEDLRRAFDQSFAEPPSTAAEEVEDVLEIELGAAPHVLRVSEISALVANVNAVPLPTTVPELLGIASIRGAILPIYDLALMLGYPSDHSTRWLAVASEAAVGMAFGSFHRHVRVRRDALVPDSHGERAVRHVREVARVDGRLRPVVSLSSVLAAITSRIRDDIREKGVQHR